MSSLIDSSEKGEGESSLMFIIFGAAIAVSVLYFAINWIYKVKEERRNGTSKSHQSDEDRPPPKTIDDMGGYEITY